jgi:prolyl 4-hydroxylase
MIEFNEDELPVARSPIKEGDILSLFPIESISSSNRQFVGLQQQKHDVDMITEENTISKQEDSMEDDVNISIHENSHGNWLSKRVTLGRKERYPYPHLRAPDNTSSAYPSEGSSLYIHSKMERSASPGWYGNMIPICTAHNGGEEGNCAFVPLPGVAPLGGMVATRDIAKGEAIQEIHNGSGNDVSDLLQINHHQQQQQQHQLDERLAALVAKQYANEIGELMPYLQMAYAQNQNQEIQTNTKIPPTFHPIHTSYPNIQQIHTDPDIYTIPDFLTREECDKLIIKSSQNMQPCLVKNADTGAVEPDPSRTSTNANIPQREVPSITQKLSLMTNCETEQLETLQVLNYQHGQKFQPHTDGFDGPTNACGFLDSGRIVTIFCYLNDVEEGGKTMFTKLGLEIKPVKGLAVVHFPMSLELVEDERTEHQGNAAVEEKWILTTWVWKHWKGDYRYDDDKLPVLSEDII